MQQVRQATSLEYEQAKVAGKPLPLFPLALMLEGCFTEEQMNANFFATLDRGYIPINEFLGKYTGSCSVVGSAPSISETWTELEGDVIAINGALKFLLDKGIIPKFAMIWDCDTVCEQFAIPHPDVTYLIASRAHPKVFERLAACNVIVWHAAGDLNIIEMMNRTEVIAKQPCHEPLINGGTAGITRGIYLALCLGYSNVHIFGGDSCYSKDGRTHVERSLVREKDITISIGSNPAFYFRTTPEWCAQVEEYRAIYMILIASGIKLSVHGGGMLGQMHAILEAQREHMGMAKFIEHIGKQEKARIEMGAKAAELANV